ncbi:MAG TPA: hypothetical protein VMG60_11340 [Burkholderiaceae bacterium]|nr:hypothetical protein [Burkholderiaceae bacterium]
MSNLTALSLWLPILLSAVLVFFASFVLHMALPWHHGDYGRIPEEQRLMDALRPLNIPPGDYMVPRPGDMKEMRTPEFQQKMQAGPVLVVTVLPNGRMAMGKYLAYWFVYCLVVGYFAAYVGAASLPPGTSYLRVFQIVGTTAFVGHALALWQMKIWYRRSLGTTIRSTMDGLLYGLLTGGTFGWLWPH